MIYNVEEYDTKYLHEMIQLTSYASLTRYSLSQLRPQVYMDLRVFYAQLRAAEICRNAAHGARGE